MRLSVWDTQVLKDRPLSRRAQRQTRYHLYATLAHHAGVQRVFWQAHSLCLGECAHGAVEVGRAGEVKQGACEFIQWHNNDIEPPMALTRAWEDTYAHVFLLLAVLLVTHQIVRQEAWWIKFKQLRATSPDFPSILLPNTCFTLIHKLGPTSCLYEKVSAYQTFMFNPAAELVMPWTARVVKCLGL